MILRINLLPPSGRTSQWPLRRLCFAGMLGALLIMVLLYSHGIYVIWQLERQLADTHNQVGLFGPARDKMIMANRLQQDIQEKNEKLAVLTGERISWYAVLSHIAASVPQGIWLTEVTMSDKNSLRVKGMATAYSELVRFLNQFSDDSLFQEPFLVLAENDAALAATRFEMTLKFRGKR